MSPREWTDLAYVVLTAAGAGAALAFAYLAGQRVMGSARFRVWAGAVLVAIPGVVLGWLLTQPELGVRSAYGGFTDAIFGTETPGAQSTPVSGSELARPRPIRRTRAGADPSPTPSNTVRVDPEHPGTGPAPPPQPPVTETPSPTQTPTPSPTPSPSTSPSPTQSPSPTPSPTASPSPSDTVVPRELISLDELLPLLEGLEVLEGRTTQP
ncbi:MAG TPA: hypothetical protein VJ979_11730 [Actinomycetota bacterium]|nr:hypothetical protein [Actinomycetota bacterium]